MDDYTSIKVTLDPKNPRGPEGSLRKFKRMCEAAGVLKEYRKRKEYKKPSIRRKEKTEAAAKRRIKDLRKTSRYSKV